MLRLRNLHHRHEGSVCTVNRPARECKAFCDELPITVVELRTGVDEPRGPDSGPRTLLLCGKDTPTAAWSIAGGGLLHFNKR